MYTPIEHSYVYIHIGISVLLKSILVSFCCTILTINAELSMSCLLIIILQSAIFNLGFLKSLWHQQKNQEMSMCLYLASFIF